VFLLIISIRVCIKEKPDIIHGHLHEGALIGKLVSVILSWGKIPVIFDVQGSLTQELETYGFFKNIKPLKKLFKMIEKLICKLPNYFVCSSPSNLNFIKDRMKVPEKKIVSVIDGIFPDFFPFNGNGDLKKQFNIPEQKKIVIYTGSLMQSKGIEHLFAAIPIIAKKYANVYFLIVGYPVEQSINRVKDLKIESLVTFTGKVEYFQLPKYLTLADVAVEPKVDEAGEGSGKIMNYMGAGLPVVCFDTINNRLFLGENGFYARAGNAEDLAHQVVEFLQDASLAKTIGEENQKRANEEFSWYANGQKLSEVYMEARNLV
jgi:glycosyltransferase involved in cell wall biosynthesis